MGSKTSIATKLDKARLVLEGSRSDAELTARLTQVGYNAAALDAGHALYVAAGGARITAFAEFGDQVGATANLNALREKGGEPVQHPGPDRHDGVRQQPGCADDTPLE